VPDQPPPPGRYATEEAAIRRVEALKKAGHWPGIIRHRDGTCDLTWDPQGLPVTRY
jgi:hypothetical protein